MSEDTTDLQHWYDDNDKAVEKLLMALLELSEGEQHSIMPHQFVEEYYRAQAWLLEHEEGSDVVYAALAAGFSYSVDDTGQTIQKFILEALPQFKPPVDLRILAFKYHRLRKEYSGTRVERIISLLGLMLHPEACKSLWPPVMDGVNLVDRLCATST